MVLQSDIINPVLSYILGKTVESEHGDSTDINYTDNSLDNTYFTKTTNINKNITNNFITYDWEFLSVEGNGYDYDAVLITLDSSAAIKFKFNSYTKDVNTAVIYTSKLFLLPDIN